MSNTWMGVLGIAGIFLVLFIAGLIARYLPSPQERARRFIQKKATKGNDDDS